MFYREQPGAPFDRDALHALPRRRAVQDTYAADQQIFPIRQDRIGVAWCSLFAFLVVPLIGNQYWLSAILIPFLIFALAALGLNILTGYAGQLSLGTAAFMAVGAFMAYNFVLRVPGMPILVSLRAGRAHGRRWSASCSACPVAAHQGLLSRRGDAGRQFFVVWALTKFGWFSNFSTSGVISAQKVVILGYAFDTPVRKYLLVLSIVVLLAVAAKNMVRSETGRSLMAVRDMDVAAGVIGIRMMHTKLLAFAVSSFYCGVAGALYAYAYIGTVEPEAFNLDLSFRVLFMIIIGGVGSILGSFLGAAFIILLPILLNTYAEPLEHLLGLTLPAGLMSNLELIIFGALIIFFLIVEPLGLARMWQIGEGEAAPMAVPALMVRCSMPFGNRRAHRRFC